MKQSCALQLICRYAILHDDFFLAINPNIFDVARIRGKAEEENNNQDEPEFVELFFDMFSQLACKDFRFLLCTSSDTVYSCFWHFALCDVLRISLPSCNQPNKIYFLWCHLIRHDTYN